jgi:hypothetical protein
LKRNVVALSENWTFIKGEVIGRVTECNALCGCSIIEGFEVGEDEGGIEEKLPNK